MSDLADILRRGVGHKLTPPEGELVVSYGGGVNTIALLLALRQHDVVPRAITMSDPGSEREATIAYRETIMRPWCAANGFPDITVVTRIEEGKHRPRAWRLETLRDECFRSRSVPSVAYGFKKCSAKYKGEPQRWWTERQPWAIEAWAAGRKVIRVIGYDKGETKRVDKSQNVEWKPDVEARRFGYWHPLYELGMDREACEAFIAAHGLPPVPKSACTYCLSGDTEVVTRAGVREIRALVGTQRLLVPAQGKLGGLMHRGAWRDAEIRSFGGQPLYEIRLHRGRSQKVVRATSAHRWFVEAADQWRPMAMYERTTATLVPGDRLRLLRASPPVKEQLVPVAVAQGFTFGDGSHGLDDYDERPANVTVHVARKAPLLSYLGRDTHAALPQTVYGLPRFWKRPPPLDESRAFLLSWLAGYFAADGSVGKNKAAELTATSKDAILFARDVAAVCGVGYSPIRERVRAEVRLPNGTTIANYKSYRLGFRLADLPEWFFINEAHRRRTATITQTPRDWPWIVGAVTSLGISEEVFCATVPDVGAFALADDLMTGNCPNNTLEEWEQLRIEEPKAFADAVEMNRQAQIDSPDVVGLMRCNPHGKRQLHVWAEGGYGCITGDSEPEGDCECVT